MASELRMNAKSGPSGKAAANSTTKPSCSTYQLKNRKV